MGARLKESKGLKLTHLAGFSRDLLCATMCNADARQQLLAHYPGLEVVLCDYALDTDDLETAFGMLVMRPVALSPCIEVRIF